MCDPLHIMTVSSLSTAGLSIVFIVIFSVGCVLQYHDISNTLHIYKFYNQLKYRTIKYLLNHTNLRKYSFYINIFTKYLMRQLTYLLLILYIFVKIWLMIVGYLDGNGTYNFANLMVHFIGFILAILHSSGMLWYGLIGWFGSALYLKMKFNENNK